MAVLNEKNEITQKIIHLMITGKCDRKCPHCCNNQYSVMDIDVVTDKEFKNAEWVFLTGGEPFAYADPCKTATEIKAKYPNIKKVFVYTNAIELGAYLKKNHIYGIDGLTMSIKCKGDKVVFENIIANNSEVLNLESNRLYTFEGFEDTECPKEITKIPRKWQAEFSASPDSIFRRIENI